MQAPNLFKKENSDSDAMDLYCSETMMNFDDSYVERSSSPSFSITLSKGSGSAPLSSGQGMNLSNMINCNRSSSVFDNSHQTKNRLKCRKKLDYENIDNCVISMLDDNDYMKIMDSSKIQNESKVLNKYDDKDNHHDTQVNFSSALLNELKKSTISDCGKIKPMKRSEHILWDNACDKAHLTSHNWSQTPSRYDQQVPEYTIPPECVSDNENTDFFILTDDAAFDSDSGSDLEWNSLTPPVPASPNDQRVPETESDFDLIGCVEQKHLICNSSPQMFSSFSPVDNSRNDWYFNQQISHQRLNVSQSETDQVVPQFL